MAASGAVTADTVTADMGEAPPHERILRAARDLFCRDGIAATGIDRVLAEAGASKMTLYTRFGSKEALLREVLRLEGADWRDAFFADLRTLPGPRNRLQMVVPALRRWFEGGRFYGCAFMNAAAERSKESHEAGNGWLRAMTREHHAAILAEFTRHAGEAGLRDPAGVARQVLLVVDGAIAALMVTGQDAPLVTAEAVIAAILAQAAQGMVRPVQEPPAR